MAPIAMWNALWFEIDGGRERYAEYGAAVMPILEQVGADILVPPLEIDQALEGRFDPDLTFFVRYPSQEAFDAMWQSDAYGHVASLRTDATRRAVLTRCAILPEDAGPVRLPRGIAVLNMLWLRPGGGERYDDYLEATRPQVEAVGGSYVVPRFRPDRAIEDDVAPDMIFIGHYPSTDALFAVVSAPEYEQHAKIRAEAVERSLTTTLRVP
jgi:uncharacterized protein (DUF1330 family)